MNYRQITAAAFAAMVLSGTPVMLNAETDPEASDTGQTQERGGQRPGRPNDNGEPPAKPEGDFAPQGRPGEMPQGEPGQMPEGEMPQGEFAPQGPGGQESGEGMNGPKANEGEQIVLPSDSEVAGNEEAKTLISKIRSLFEQLKNMLTGKKEEAPADADNTQTATGEKPSMPNGNAESQAGGQSKPGNGQSGRPGEMSGGNSAPESFESAATLTADSAVEASYTSTGDSENAVLISGETVSLEGTTITKSGSASGDNADFYGTNAAILANNGAEATLTGITVNTDGAHANAVFSYGSGTTVNISDSNITTKGNNSGGIMVTGGGTIKADNLTVSTAGNSSAAIRSDRGGGTVNVTGGSYSSAGKGSPAIYSTADINVKNAILDASYSEAVVIEGGNTVTLTDCDVTGNDAALNGKSQVMTNVLIYQSMSGDASNGASTFTMTGGTLTSKIGAMFHVTNTTTTINLDGVTMNYASDSDVFLDASADAWGNEGKNGGKVTLNLTNQTIEGAIVCDEVSEVNVNLGTGSFWTLKGDSYITSFSGDYSAINLNGYRLFINGVEYNG